jgi:Flp pilus assembly protein TadG
MLKCLFHAVRDRSGLAAVEFAVILPVMIVLFFGIYETSQALSARADVVNLASAAADLVAQENAATTDDINNVFAAAGQILFPYPRADTQRPSIRISSIVDDGTAQHNLNVSWACTQAGSAPLGTAPAPPQGVITSGGSLIRVEVAYQYNSPTTRTIVGPIIMRSTFFARPRRAMQITGPVGNCDA